MILSLTVPDHNLPVAFLAEHGAPWNARADDLADEHSIGYLADGMRRQMEALFATEVMQAKAPALKVHVAILPRGDLRCFVWRDKSRPSEYVVAIYIGVFERFNELLSAEALWADALPKLKYLKRLDSRDFQRLCTYLAIFNAASHEFAHIVRGHLSWRDAVARATPDKLEDCRKLCEVDADRCGSFILAGQIAMHSTSLSQSMYGSLRMADKIALDLINVLSITLYRCFSIYNQLGLKQSSYYPHPLLRVINMAIGVADNFSKSNSSTEIRDRLVTVLRGVELAEEYASKSGDLPQKGWDFAGEIIAFQEKFSAKLDNLAKTLAPFSPANASNIA